MKFTVQEIVEATEGVLLQGDSKKILTSISTDSRTLKKGDLFVCLSGPRFDGHQFIDEVLQRGALGILLKKERWEAARWEKASAVFIGVGDPLQAFGDLARAWRRRFRIPLVAITGSNGKTTTKDMAAAILGRRFKTLATEGNLNNLVGVPHMLFRLKEGHEAAVIEMGMNDFGEIARLARIAEPTVGLITNVALAHLEKLKTLEGVAKAKGELFEVLPPGSVALVNQDDPWIAKLPTRGYRISFGIENNADVFCSRFELTEKGIRFEVIFRGKKTLYFCPVFGKANVKNAVAAIAVGCALGVDPDAIARALKDFSGRAMRMERIPFKNGTVLYNDCYNANPSSTEVALETLADLKGEHPGLAILGEMLEMGDFAVEGHRRVGKAVGENKIGYLIAVGPHAKDLVDAARRAGVKEECSAVFESQEEAHSLLAEWAPKARRILIKGSRGAQMEKITEYLKQLFA